MEYFNSQFDGIIKKYQNPRFWKKQGSEGNYFERT
ncbi:hypothetical protein CLV42_103268 [Chitinophaga ginsengisoli]|uniref:Uncharacterized protein n=1 Tax=Chitinophaga ginsengisoli TaxID=363837 RepID=A0A2P8GH67_9BACT|nr:hypothetical protein CLV42_103268 [Chitinophaga ginsengisoli]